MDDDVQASYLSNLADVLGKRYNLTHNLEDLDEAIRLRQGVVDLSPPPPNVDHIDALRILAQHLLIRRRRGKNVEILNTVISVSRTAYAFGMLNDSTKVKEAAGKIYLLELAEAVCSRYRIMRQDEDLQESIELYEKSSKISPSRNKTPRSLSFLSSSTTGLIVLVIQRTSNVPFLFFFSFSPAVRLLIPNDIILSLTLAVVSNPVRANRTEETSERC